jgi:dUTP pyrophosphatase
MSERLIYQGTAPVRGYDDDAGLDLTAAETKIIQPWKIDWIDLDCRIALPHGYWTMLVGRSSSIKRRGLWVHSGVIDPGYTGPLFAGCMNVTEDPVVVEKGDRIAQLLIMRNHTKDVILVEGMMPMTARGDNGFGSTGL